MREILKRTPLYPLYARMKERTTIEDSEQTLIYIHIGKCGGSSLWDAIQRSPVVNDQFKTTHKIHIKKPPILQKARYLIVVRNPIERAISAFNWRYKLVVEDEVQVNRFKGEYDILLEYKSLNAMAEALYDTDGELNLRTNRQFRTIHHLKESIAFYLTDLLSHLYPEQLFAVLATETLDQDIANALQIGSVPKNHSNKDSVQSEKLWLSNSAKLNLHRFLADDYVCVEKLLHLARISDDRCRTLLA